MKEFVQMILRRFVHYRTDDDLQEEMRVDAEMEAEDRQARGASEQEAKRWARLHLGDAEVAVERIRDGEWITTFEGWFRDMVNGPHTYFGCSFLGRLEPGISASTARAEAAHLQQKSWLTPFVPVSLQHLPFFEKAYLRVTSAHSGLRSYVTQTYGKPLFLMQGLVGVVLLLCCVNVGGLMMAKAYAQQREFAVRTALGACVGRLVRQYLTESLILALAGSLLGAVLAWRGMSVLLHFFRGPMMGEAMEAHPDQSLLLVTGGWCS